MKRSYLLIIFMSLHQFLLHASVDKLDRVNEIKPPRYTIVIVLDQCPYRYFPQFAPYFTGGLKKLIQQGTFFTHAYHPHGIPETTPGHHAISTGTLPKDHGAVTNQWFDEVTYEKIKYEDTIIDQKTVQSPRRTMVDGLSDQFLSARNQHPHKKVYAFSLKVYPAIACANHLGMAFWFDIQRGHMTTSAHYAEALPDWLQAFNAQHDMSKKKSFSWPCIYQSNDKAYQFPHIDNYKYAGLDFKLAGNNHIPIDPAQKAPFELFIKTPVAAQLMLDCAQACVKQHIDHDETAPLLLWISLSNLDLAGHMYGPHSKEIVDTMYHIDRQLNHFFAFLSKEIKPEELLLVLTSDHGIAPIPEIMQEQGYRKARRIMVPDLINRLNEHCKKTLGFRQDVAKGFEPSSIQLDQKLLKSLKADKRKALETCIIDFLHKEPGIKHAWTYDELKNAPLHKSSLEQFYKNQLYADRIGDIIVQPDPFCLITNYATGTSHMTPYAYDTQVPLIFYRKGSIGRKRIHKPVVITRLPVTLAGLLDIMVPSASIFKPLPGIIGNEI